mgnify:CR=1 FL=1
MLTKPVLTLSLAAALIATVGATSGCAVARDQQTAGSYIDDAALTTRVKAKFAADPTVSAQAISVEANMTYEEKPAGTTLKIVMVSRFGDCGLTDDLNAEFGYHVRIDLDSPGIRNLRWTP